MNDETGRKILQLLDVLSVEVAAGRNDIRGLDAKVTGLDAKVTGLDAKVAGLDAKVTGLEAKVDRLDRRLGRVETRVEGVETELRLFRHEFERRIAPLERWITD
jgi:archaellum component FlaC